MAQRATYHFHSTIPNLQVWHPQTLALIATFEGNQFTTHDEETAAILRDIKQVADASEAPEVYDLEPAPAEEE